MALELVSPVGPSVIARLRAGDEVLISGVVYNARDAAHKRLVAALKEGKPLPLELSGQTIYYMGPSPAPPGRAIGSAGPTTSSRMDRYTIPLLQAGVKAMIGKGARSPQVRQATKEYQAVYFAAIAGAGALISRCIRKAEVVAYPELGAEAILRLEVENLHAIVINDIYGGDWYEEGRARYRQP